MSTPAGTKTNPVFIRMVTNEAGGLRMGRLLMALAMTAGLAYLSVAVQRGMSGPDVGRTMQMRGARAVKGFADSRAEFWSGVSARAATVYVRATL